MNVRLGLRRIGRRNAGTDHIQVEEERYDDLRDTEGMIDLADYADLRHRHHEAVSYIDLAPSLLDLEARRRDQLDNEYDSQIDRFHDLGDLSA